MIVRVNRNPAYDVTTRLPPPIPSAPLDEQRLVIPPDALGVMTLS
jgi:hypothetical protein